MTLSLCRSGFISQTNLFSKSNSIIFFSSSSKRKSLPRGFCDREAKAEVDVEVGAVVVVVVDVEVSPVVPLVMYTAGMVKGLVSTCRHSCFLQQKW